MEFKRTMAEWSVGGSHLRWGAVFAGLVVGISVQMALTLLGLAIGAWSIDLQETQPTRVPISTGIWTGISMLISAFTGSFVTGRLSGAPLRADGMYHGAVLWGLTWMIFAWLTTTALATMVGGLFSVFSSGLQVLGQGASQGISATTSKVDVRNLSMSVEGVKKQIESVVRATQKSELRPSELKKDANKAKEQVQSGQPISQLPDTVVVEVQEKLEALDKDAAVNIMINKLDMSHDQAQEVVQSTVGIIEPIKEKAQEVKEQSVESANSAIKKLAAVAGWMFVLALLCLATSLSGGAFGIRDDAMRGFEGRTEVHKAA